MSGNADNVVQAQHIGSITFNAAPAAAPHLHSVNPPTLDVPVRGREAELFGLLGMLEQPRGQFAVISGPGGSGKSTLAAELAARAMRADVTVWWIRWHDKESFATQLRGDRRDARPAGPARDGSARPASRCPSTAVGSGPMARACWLSPAATATGTSGAAPRS